MSEWNSMNLCQVRTMMLDEANAKYRYRRGDWQDGTYITVVWRRIGSNRTVPSIIQSSEVRPEMKVPIHLRSEDILYEDWEAYLPATDNAVPVEVQAIVEEMGVNGKGK